MTHSLNLNFDLACLKPKQPIVRAAAAVIEGICRTCTRPFSPSRVRVDRRRPRESCYAGSSRVTITGISSQSLDCGSSALLRARCARRARRFRPRLIRDLSRYQGLGHDRLTPLVEVQYGGSAAALLCVPFYGMSLSHAE